MSPEQQLQVSHAPFRAVSSQRNEPVILPDNEEIKFARRGHRLRTMLQKLSAGQPVTRHELTVPYLENPRYKNPKIAMENFRSGFKLLARKLRKHGWFISRSAVKKEDGEKQSFHSLAKMNEAQKLERETADYSRNCTSLILPDNQIIPTERGKRARKIFEAFLAAEKTGTQISVGDLLALFPNEKIKDLKHLVEVMIANWRKTIEPFGWTIASIPVKKSLRKIGRPRRNYALRKITDTPNSDTETIEPKDITPNEHRRHHSLSMQPSLTPLRSAESPLPPFTEFPLPPPPTPVTIFTARETEQTLSDRSERESYQEMRRRQEIEEKKRRLGLGLTSEVLFHLARGNMDGLSNNARRYLLSAARNNKDELCAIIGEHTFRKVRESKAFFAELLTHTLQKLWNKKPNEIQRDKPLSFLEHDIVTSCWLLKQQGKTTLKEVLITIYNHFFIPIPKEWATQ